VRTWRKLQRLTQSELADRAGIDQRTLRNLEAGRGTMSFEAALRVLNGLGVLDTAIDVLDPYNSEVGRLRADERLPERVRHA
jgi:transcriptional regulator with XRE-family HTH domain